MRPLAALLIIAVLSTGALAMIGPSSEASPTYEVRFVYADGYAVEEASEATGYLVTPPTDELWTYSAPGMDPGNIRVIQYWDIWDPYEPIKKDTTLYALYPPYEIRGPPSDEEGWGAGEIAAVAGVIAFSIIILAVIMRRR